MSAIAPITSSSFDVPVSGTPDSSERFREAARDVGGALRALGNFARRTSIGVTLAGLAAFGANMISATHPANAQTITLGTDCKAYKPGVIGADGICEIEKNKLAHQLAAEQNARHLCIVQLVDFQKRDPAGFVGLVQRLKIGSVTEDNACTLSVQIPKPSAAGGAPGTRPSAG